MKLILITGKTGSGKNRLSELISQKCNFLHIDIDKICHTCYDDQTITDSVTRYFGEGILTNGKVDRKKLGAIVFSDKTKLKVLNDITYNFVIGKIDKIISGTNKTVILNYVLLPDTKYWQYDSYKILAKCHDDNKRYSELVKRDNVSLDYIISRDKNSLNYSEKDFDFIFENDYTSQTLERSVQNIIQDIKEKLWT